jgi:hypothetical protein
MANGDDANAINLSTVFWGLANEENANSSWGGDNDNKWCKKQICWKNAKKILWHFRIFPKQLKQCQLPRTHLRVPVALFGESGKVPSSLAIVPAAVSERGRREGGMAFSHRLAVPIHALLGQNQLLGSAGTTNLSFSDGACISVSHQPVEEKEILEKKWWFCK